MGFWSNLIGTSETAFKIGKGKSTIDAGSVTAPRTHTLPDASGTIALTNSFTRVLPFTLSDGTPSNIPLIANGTGFDIPFTLANGETSNIPTAVT